MPRDATVPELATSPFFFASTEITGLPRARFSLTSGSMNSNCSLRSGLCLPSLVFEVCPDAVAHLAQEVTDDLAADSVACPCEFGAEFAQFLARPAEDGLRALSVGQIE